MDLAGAFVREALPAAVAGAPAPVAAGGSSTSLLPAIVVWMAFTKAREANSAWKKQRSQIRLAWLGGEQGMNVFVSSDFRR